MGEFIEGEAIMSASEVKARKFFEEPHAPTMTELVSWFQTEHMDLAKAMKDSDHASEEGQPNAYHVEGTVWAHTMMVCQEARFDHKINKLAALFHDVGKPSAREVIPINAPKPSMNGEERVTTTEINSDGRKVKTHFRGHEGMSFWIAIDPLYDLVSLGVINTDEMEEILHIISLHGTLFNRIKDGREHKPEQVAQMFDSIEKYERFIKQSRNDSLGRFYKSGSGSRADVASLLGETVYGPDVYYANNKEHGIDLSKPTVHVLVGLPASGKTTFIEENFGNSVIISKDNQILEMGRKIGLDKYTDVYKALSKEEHDEAYAQVIENHKTAVKNQDEIVVDLTNMSKKSRNKWMHMLGNRYNTKAYVFVAGQSMLASRNILRAQKENKHIPYGVYQNMMKSFLVPTLYEFDEIEYVFQNKGVR